MRSHSLSAAWSPLLGARLVAELVGFVERACDGSFCFMAPSLQAHARARGWPARAATAPVACAAAARSRSRLRSSCILAGAVLLRPVDVGVADLAPPRCSVQAGLARCGRATAHRSARPAAMMLLTWSASEIAPTAMVGDAGLVADAVGERRLVHAAVDRLLLLADLARRAVDQVGAGGLEGARDLDRVVGRDAAFDPVVRRDAHRHRQVLRPGRAHRAEHLERIAQAVRQRAAVLVGALVGQRRDEATTAGSRARSAARASRSRPRRRSASRARSRRARGPCRRASSRRDQSLTPSRYCCGEAEISGQLPASQRLVDRRPRARGSSPWRRRGRAASRSWRRCCACTKSTMRFQAVALRRRSTGPGSPA